MTQIVNLTPHAIRVLATDRTTVLLDSKPSGTIARVSVLRQEMGVVPLTNDAAAILAKTPGSGIPVFASAYGATENVPPTELFKVFIVSALVRLALPRRRDVLSPGELVRDGNGQPIGCIGLEVNP